MASHLLPLTLSVTVVIDVRHAYIITLPALFINPSDYLTVTFARIRTTEYHVIPHFTTLYYTLLRFATV